jgi:aspartate aminotransferase
MRAVKAAEKRMWEEQETKAYTGLAGDPAFADAMIDLVLAGAVPRDTIAAVATPGGTGACRQAFELVQMARPKPRIFVSDPTWPNHLSILKHLGMEVVPYRYFDPTPAGSMSTGMLEDIAQAGPDDVVLLHGCCHNPTGANLNSSEWDAVIASLQKTGATAMIDIAYQGFGDGLDADAAPTRKIAAALPEVLIAASCSKNFGVYRERTGLLMLVSQDKGARGVNQGNLNISTGRTFPSRRIMARGW